MVKIQLSPQVYQRVWDDMDENPVHAVWTTNQWLGHYYGATVINSDGFGHGELVFTDPKKATEFVLKYG